MDDAVDVAKPAKRLMIDILTRQNTNIVAVSIQYWGHT